MFNLKIKQNLKYTHRHNTKLLIFKQMLDIPTRVHWKLQFMVLYYSHQCVLNATLQGNHTHIHSLFKEILWALWFSDWYCWRFTSLGCDAMLVGEQLPVLWWHYYPSEHHTLWCSVGRWAAPNSLRALLSFRTSCTTCPMTQCHSPEEMNSPHSIFFCIFLLVVPAAEI